jgi:glycosyltransferase involved in cell wall biosynthesis
MTTTSFTCLIPAWNEAPRLPAVLRAVVGHPDLAEVIVIDDGSTDGTADVARAAGVTVLQTPGNLGKTQALMAGIARAKGSHLVLIDGDLTGLSAGDISALIAPVARRHATCSLSLRGNAPRLWRMLGVDYISGERVIPRAMVLGQETALTRLRRFGFEVFVNRLILTQGAPVAIVAWPGVASPTKAAKRGGVWRGIRADLAMLGDIFATIPLPEILRQIAGLRRLSRLAVQRAE